MRFIFLIFLFGFIIGCDDINDMPPASAVKVIPEEANGYFCGMFISEHAGAKGQVILHSRKEPLWFTSPRNVFAFSMLGESPKDISGIFVTDTIDGKESRSWINATKAFFVIETKIKDTMGAYDAIPFKDEAVAIEFAKANKGRMVKWDEMPITYILGDVYGDDE